MYINHYVSNYSCNYKIYVIHLHKTRLLIIIVYNHNTPKCLIYMKKKIVADFLTNYSIQKYKPEYVDMLLKYFCLHEQTDELYVPYAHKSNQNRMTGDFKSTPVHRDHHPTLAGFLALYGLSMKAVNAWVEAHEVLTPETEDKYPDEVKVELEGGQRVAMLNPEWIIAMDRCKSATEHKLLAGSLSGAMNSGVSKWLLSCNHGYKAEEEEIERGTKIELHISKEASEL